MITIPYLNKGNIFKLIILIWVVLWLLFLIREDKDGQYRSLRYLYSSDYHDKVRHITGGELYDFLIFCKWNIPQGSSYSIEGFDKFSREEVQARYILWPLIRVEDEADYHIVYGKGAPSRTGYEEYGEYKGGGSLFRKAGGDR